MSEEVQNNCHNNNQVTVRQPLQKCWVTIEPSVFLITFAMSLVSSVITELLLVRNCQKMFPNNATKCDILINKEQSTEAQELEELVQPHVSLFQMYKTLIEACLPALMSLYLGPWSDYNGRKPLILWPQFGYGLLMSTYAILSVLPDVNPMFFLLASVPVAMSGGLISIVSGIYAYISDISTPEKRAFRMGMLDATFFGGFMMGTLCSAPLFSAGGKFGYLTVFSTGATCSFLGFLYINFVPESVNVIQNEYSRSSNNNLLDSQLVFKMLRICFKKRDHYGRSIIFLIIVILSTHVITMEGESAVSFLYTRKKFHWNLTSYTHYSSTASLIAILGTMSGIYLFSVRLKISDAVFGMGVFILKCCQTVVYGLAPKDYFMYIASVIGLLGGVSGPLCRSILSKTVSKEDLGSVFAMAAVVEALTPLAASPMYTFVYNSTLYQFPGAFFILSSIIYLLDFTFMSIVLLLQRISPIPQYTQVPTD